MGSAVERAPSALSLFPGLVRGVEFFDRAVVVGFIIFLTVRNLISGPAS